MKPLCFTHDVLPIIAATMRQRPCVLCGKGGVEGVGAFFPADSPSFGAPAGKQRVLFYPVHGACREAATDDMLAVIEEQLRREVLPPARN